MGFTLPLLQNVLTHALPTAYDRQGRCRKLGTPASKAERMEAVKSREADEELHEEMTEAKEANEILNRMKSSFLSGKMLPSGPAEDAPASVTLGAADASSATTT